MLFVFKRHISKTCKSFYVCRKCGGKHHISICKFEEKNDNPEAVVRDVESCRTILLQTARGSCFRLVYPVICSDIKGQLVSVAKSNTIIFPVEFSTIWKSKTNVFL